MAISELGKVCLFSEISGVITLDGKPVANAKLVRTANRDGDITDETTTDEHGKFTMPAVYERTITKFLPMEFVVSQEIEVSHCGKKYKMWDGIKRKREENTESRGKPLVVSCELNSEEKHIRVDGAGFFTLCTWDVEPDKAKNWDQLFEPDTE